MVPISPYFYKKLNLKDFIAILHQLQQLAESKLQALQGGNVIYYSPI